MGFFRQLLGKGTESGLEKKITLMTVTLSDGSRCMEQTHNFTHPTEIGKALTEAIDNRNDKSMYLVSFSPRF